MKGKTGLVTALLYVIHVCAGLSFPALADGRFLRGEEWAPFKAQEAKADFFVAENGDDSWSGTMSTPNKSRSDGPFASIERARQAVRVLKNKIFLPKKDPIEKRWIGSPHPFGQGRDILVLVRKGYYYLDAPLTFTSADGGERVETDYPSGAFEYHKLKDYFVTYSAYPGESPVISGGRKIAGWRKQGASWVASAKNFELKRLIADGRPMVLARSPNSGYFLPPSFPRSNQELPLRKDQFAALDDLGDNRVVMLLRWHKGVNAFTRIDRGALVGYLEKPQPGILLVPPRYYVENSKAFLDAPQEWFFDKITGVLSLIPPESMPDPNNANISAPVLKRLLRVDGERQQPVRNLRFYGLTFEATDTGESALEFRHAHRCELAESDLRAIGGGGVALGAGCYQTRVLRNRMRFVDEGGVLIKGVPHPDHWADMVRENRITHNTFEDCGGTNIAASNCLDTTISHNEIAHTHGRYAISLGGWSNQEEAVDGGYRVEYNHLRNVLKEADDSGAIKTAGLTHHSVIRHNLIHDVSAGYFNDNVGFWFDNMSSGWRFERNIFYNLEQGEMKLCAALLSDNVYLDNFVIEVPERTPEGIIDGMPEFEYRHLAIARQDRGAEENPIHAGELVFVRANVFNSGATGMQSVRLYVDGKVAQEKLFPVINGNVRTVSFEVRFDLPGEHRVAIETTPYESVRIIGKSVSLVYDNLQVSPDIAPQGEEITLSTWLHNLSSEQKTGRAPLYVDEERRASQMYSLAAKESGQLEFVFTPGAGEHEFRIGDGPERVVHIYPYRLIEAMSAPLETYHSATAQSCLFHVDQSQNRFGIETSGSDFFHAEDSYGVIFLAEKVKGNFSATVRITRFGEQTHEWFRAGLFVRNEMTDSFDIEPGSKGSVLMFATPKRTGIQWDEFGDGCMHKADSHNLSENLSAPMWLKLTRQGNRFSGSIRFPGEAWRDGKHTPVIPGIGERVHVGIAAGSCDQETYSVEFESFYLRVEQEP